MNEHFHLHFLNTCAPFTFFKNMAGPQEEIPEESQDGTQVEKVEEKSKEGGKISPYSQSFTNSFLT